MLSRGPLDITQAGKTVCHAWMTDVQRTQDGTLLLADSTRYQHSACRRHCASVHDLVLPAASSTHPPHRRTSIRRGTDRLQYKSVSK